MKDKKQNLGALLAAASSALNAVKVLGPEMSIRHQQQVILMDRLLREMRADWPGETGKRLVVYFGRCYYIPDYYAFIATDEDGAVYAYEEEPRYDLDADAWFGSCCFGIDCRDDLEPATSLAEIGA